MRGETRVATDDTLEPQPLLPHPEIRLWDLSDGKLLRTFGDPKLGARRFVGASSDGNVILGYIPKETLHSGGGIEGGLWNQTLEQRFRLWDADTGQTIATSPPLLPIESSTIEGFDPSLQVSRQRPRCDRFLEVAAGDSSALRLLDGATRTVAAALKFWRLLAVGYACHRFRSES